MSQPVSGSAWIDFDENGKRIFSINPNGQNLGNTRLTVYRDTAAIRDTAGQYYGGRNWVVQTANPPTADVRVRYYFTDSEANKLIRCRQLCVLFKYGRCVFSWHHPIQQSQNSGRRQQSAE